MAAPVTTPWGTGTAGTYYFFDQVIASEGRKNNGVVSGLAVTQSGTPSLTLQVASGIFHQTDPSTPQRSYAGGTVTLSAADATYPRVDYITIYWNGSAGVPVVTTGTPDNSAPLPALPIPSNTGISLDVVLAIVVVAAGVTTILDENIYDRRFFIAGSVATTDGTEVAPAYAFSSNSGTGWWFDFSGASLVASVYSTWRCAIHANGLIVRGNSTDFGVLYLDQGSGGVGARVMLGAGTTPSTPGAGVGALYLDSASKNIALKDDAGVVKHGVQTKASVSNNFLTAISDAGVVSAAQPAFSNLSGSVAASQMPALTGDVTTSAGAVATTIANDAVTYAKMQNVSAASKLLGRGSASGSGDPEEITLGTNLSMSGTTLNASGSGSTPTGTGFRHVTSGAEDAASTIVGVGLQIASGTLLAGAPYAEINNFSYNTDSTERTVWSFTVNANDLSTKRLLLFFISGNLLCSSGSPVVTAKLKLGSTTLWGDAAAAITANAARKALWLIGGIGNIGATNSQFCWGRGGIGNINAASVAGIGEIAAPATAESLSIGPFRGTASEDTTTNLTLAFTWQMSVSNVGDELVIDKAIALMVNV